MWEFKKNNLNLLNLVNICFCCEVWDETFTVNYIFRLTRWYTIKQYILLKSNSNISIALKYQRIIYFVFVSMPQQVEVNHEFFNDNSCSYYVWFTFI